MDMHRVSLRGVKVDPAHELATSEGTRPYVECLIKAYRDNALGLEAALEVIRDLPLGKQYTWRVLSALKWAFADFEDEYVGLDLPHIPEPHEVGDDQGTRTAPPSVADVVGDIPHRIELATRGDVGVVRAASPAPGGQPFFELASESMRKFVEKLNASLATLLPTSYKQVHRDHCELGGCRM